VCLGVAALAFHFGLILSLIYVPVALSVVFVYQLIYSYVLESIARKKAQLIAEKHQILLDSINYASVIQTGLLPKPSIFSKAFADHSVIWNPRDTVGGDIYWIKKFENSGTLLAVADCTGHGVPGALLTALVVSSLEEIVNETSSQSPAEILFELDNKLARVFEAKGERTAKDAGEQENAPPIKIKNGCDIAVLFITEGDGAVRIASGNINVFICNGKEVSRVKGQRISIGEGKIKESAEIKETLISADKSNKFYIASDGLYDQIGGSHSHSFGYNAFKKLILDNHNEAQSIITERIWAAFENYRGDHIRLDDFELVAFRPFIEP
jgi:serine phosphatase RsbU (regulator of sigma subunit)